MWKLVRLQRCMQQSPLKNPLMSISYGLLVCGEAGVAHGYGEEAKLLHGSALRIASRELWLFISRCFDNMYDQCSVWKCYATLHYTLTSLRGLRILWGYGTSPAWGAPTLFVGSPTFYSWYYQSPVCLKRAQKKGSKLSCFKVRY